MPSAVPALSQHQIEYGVSQIQRFSEDLNLPPRKIIDILLAVHDLKNFYNWKNADEFIIMAENEEIELEEKREVKPVMVYLNGRGKPAFKCSCGCNVFHHPEIGEERETLRTYICNACNTQYIGE